MTADATYHLAEALAAQGNFEEAIEQSRLAKAGRDAAYGPMHARSIDSCKQLSNFLTYNFDVRDGFITTEYRMKCEEAVLCQERHFKWLKSQRPSSKSDMQQYQDTLLQLTRQMLSLKFSIIPNKYKEVLRAARQNTNPFTEEAIKETIMRLVHITPNAYLAELYNRIDSKEPDVFEEFAIVVNLAESQSMDVA